MKETATMGYIFTLLGAGMLLGAILLYRSTRSFLVKALSAEGTVIDFITSRRRNSNSGGHTTTYHPVIEYTSTDKDIIQFISSVGSNPPEYSVGERVEVLYLPGETQEAKVNSSISLWGGIHILASLGSIFFLLGVGVILRVPIQSALQ